jgi:hypothetical protein
MPCFGCFGGGRMVCGEGKVKKVVQVDHVHI